MAHSHETTARKVGDILGKGPMMQGLGVRTEACEKHGEFESTGSRFLGTREIWTQCPACAAEEKAAAREAEAQRQAEAQRARIEKMISRAAVPTRFIGRTFANFKATTDGQEHALEVASEFAEAFDEKQKRGLGLVFSGMPGTGKSHLAAAILQSILDRHTGLYTTAMGLIRMVRATWHRESDRTEEEVLAMLASVDLLVIDEIGVQYGTEGEQTILFEVLDRRYCDMKPTILLTNQGKDGFRDYIGARSFDRLTETARWVSFDWASYRLQARKEAE